MRNRVLVRCFVPLHHIELLLGQFASFDCGGTIFLEVLLRRGVVVDSVELFHSARGEHQVAEAEVADDVVRCIVGRSECGHTGVLLGGAVGKIIMKIVDCF